jgi:hypothetical protein
VRPELLAAYRYFDRSDPSAGYLRDTDAEDLIFALGRQIPKRRVQQLVLAASTSGKLHYRRLTDKDVPTDPAMDEALHKDTGAAFVPLEGVDPAATATAMAFPMHAAGHHAHAEHGVCAKAWHGPTSRVVHNRVNTGVLCLWQGLWWSTGTLWTCRG